MAKQTFTTGQILTAAQMTSLQQTAMGGGSATAKTASYVLVAADAGATVAMSAAGATTITVNTGLFAAGDTVFIQNLGVGACTVTAGTATVATAGSLILPQNDAGILYFTATGAAIFYDYIQTGAASPLTTKGDLYTFSTSDTRLGVGTNNYVLTADSAEATGLKWAAPSGGSSGLTFITGGTFTNAATVNVNSCFTSTYANYKIILNLTAASGSGLNNIRLRASGTDTTTSYNDQRYRGDDASYGGFENQEGTSYWTIGGWGGTDITFGFEMDLYSPQLARRTMGLARSISFYSGGNTFDVGGGLSLDNSTQYDGISFIPTASIEGQYRIYGYQNS